jgi:hypothetical protein
LGIINGISSSQLTQKLGNHQARNSPMVNLRGYHRHVSNKALGDAHQRCFRWCWHVLTSFVLTKWGPLDS